MDRNCDAYLTLYTSVSIGLFHYSRLHVFSHFESDPKLINVIGSECDK